MSANRNGGSLSAIIPIRHYSLHRENILYLLQDLSKYEIEVILVLDSEPTKSLLDLEILMSQLRISGKVIQIKAGNPGDTRNVGNKSASRDWVVFWDCDDRPIVETYIKMIDQAEADGAQIVVGGYLSINKNTQKTSKHKIERKNPGIHVGLNPGIWRMAFQRKLIQQIDFPSLSMGEDQVFLARVLKLNPTIGYLNEFAYMYVTGNQNQLTENPDRRREIQLAHQILVDEQKHPKLHKKIISTMLLRQGFTLLKQQELGLGEKLRVALSQLIQMGLNPKILFIFIRYKVSKTREIRASQ